MLIKICSREEADKLLRQHYPINTYPNVISISNLSSSNPSFSAWKYQRLLSLKFDDLPVEGYASPKKIHVETIICFAKEVGTARDLIVHCEAGISRSAAVALLVASLETPLTELENKFRDKIGLIYPNNLILRYADELLSYNGELLKVGESICNKSFQLGMEENI